MQVVSTDLDYLSVSYASGLEQARICRPDLRFEALLQEVGATFVCVLDLERPSGRSWDSIGRRYRAGGHHRSESSRAALRASSAASC
jgi:hypothetical protein